NIPITNYNSWSSRLRSYGDVNNGQQKVTGIDIPDCFIPNVTRKSLFGIQSARTSPIISDTFMAVKWPAHRKTDSPRVHLPFPRQWRKQYLAFFNKKY
ncbi:MAG TPA: hypothetical protein VN038_22680, partial [Dyadobacter sp.]|nr:hypothetical protein [Dyadobacter sp.]